MTHLNKFKDLFTWFPKYMDLDETLGQVQGPRVDFTLAANTGRARECNTVFTNLPLFIVLHPVFIVNKCQYPSFR